MFQEPLRNPLLIPDSLTLGLTHMIPKGENISDSKKFSIISTQRELRNISVSWIDYKKVFGSMPHSRLLNTFRLCAVSESEVKLLEHLMKSWRTHLLFNIDGKMTTTPEIRIRALS